MRGKERVDLAWLYQNVAYVEGALGSGRTVARIMPLGVTDAARGGVKKRPDLVLAEGLVIELLALSHAHSGQISLAPRAALKAD